MYELADLACHSLNVLLGKTGHVTVVVVVVYGVYAMSALGFALSFAFVGAGATYAMIVVQTSEVMQDVPVMVDVVTSVVVALDHCFEQVVDYKSKKVVEFTDNTVSVENLDTSVMSLQSCGSCAATGPVVEIDNASENVCKKSVIKGRDSTAVNDAL